MIKKIPGFIYRCVQLLLVECVFILHIIYSHLLSVFHVGKGLIILNCKTVNRTWSRDPIRVNLCRSEKVFLLLMFGNILSVWPSLNIWRNTSAQFVVYAFPLMTPLFVRRVSYWLNTSVPKTFAWLSMRFWRRLYWPTTSKRWNQLVLIMKVKTFVIYLLISIFFFLNELNFDLKIIRSTSFKPINL